MNVCEDYQEQASGPWMADERTPDFESASTVSFFSQ